MARETEQRTPIQLRQHAATFPHFGQKRVATVLLSPTILLGPNRFFEVRFKLAYSAERTGPKGLSQVRFGPVGSSAPWRQQYVTRVNVLADVSGSLFVRSTNLWPLVNTTKEKARPATCFLS